MNKDPKRLRRHGKVQQHENYGEDFAEEEEEAEDEGSGQFNTLKNKTKDFSVEVIFTKRKV